ncbi:MAG: sugar kinase [Acidobacteria bacterium]|nr:MAG: sugar kinase [Acidobacteriota bacterium]
MERLTENKIILVTRPTRLDELIARFNTVQQAQFYIEHLGADFSDYLAEDHTYKADVRAAETELATLGRIQKLDRSFLPNFIFGKSDVIVVLGQDGLVANTLKYTPNQLVIGVNPDPSRWDGILLPFQTRDLRKILLEVFASKRSVKEVTMAKATLNTGETLYAVNDFFVGPKSHVSARYVIEVDGKNEQQSSSGIIVSTGLGSTGWLKSLLAGATAIAGAVSQRDLGLEKRRPISWDADFLYYTVREPFPSKTSSTSLVFGKITTQSPLRVHSQMPEHGVIFSDGIETDFLRFNSGTQATITLAERKGRLVI